MIKRCCGIILLFSCSAAFLYGTDSKELENKLRHARSLFSEELYSDALAHYEEIASLSMEDSTILLEIASCYLKLNNPQSAYQSLEGFADHTNPSFIYLSGIALRHLKRYDEALHILKNTPPFLENDALSNEIQLELGINSFFLHQYASAQQALEKVVNIPENPSLYYHAQLYLIKSALAEKKFDRVQLLINDLKTSLSTKHRLLYELSYLEGLKNFATHHYENALSNFRLSLPSNACSWAEESLRGILKCHLQLSSSSEITSIEAEADALMSKGPHADDIFLLIDIYTSQWQNHQDIKAYKKAQDLIEQAHRLLPESHQKIKLKEIALLSNTPKKVGALNQLLKDTALDDGNRGETLYVLARCHYDEAINLKKSLSSNADLKKILQKASESFGEAYPLLKENSAGHALSCKKFQSIADYFQDNSKKALVTLLTLINEPMSPTEKKELYGLGLLYSKSLSSQEKDLINRFETSLKNDSDSSLELATLLIQQNKQDEARGYLLTLRSSSPEESGEILFLLASCTDESSDFQTKKHYLETLYQTYPLHSRAAEAYLNLYSVNEYLYGHKKAIKHLQSMPSQFPHHPLIITCYYLLGLDKKKDLYSDEGSLLRKKDLVAAIEYFQKAEEQFEKLLQEKIIGVNALSYFMQLQHRARMERGLVNLAIAESSEGTKRKIYLDYAEGVFKELLKEFENPSQEVSFVYFQNTTPPILLAESELHLGEILIKKGSIEEAKAVFANSIDRLKKAQVSEGYFLSTLWNRKGSINYTQHQYHEALEDFLCAERASVPIEILSVDEKLDLWIQQSCCLKELKRYDESMKLLSKAVNDESISSLRLKAMYLRAQLYQVQGKQELALKQLEALSKKGGAWALQAKEQLDKDYGYTVLNPR